MDRRLFLRTLAAPWVAGPVAAFAQTPSRRPLIAALVGGSKVQTERYFGGFLQGLRELGYAQGRDYDIEVRYADGVVSRIPVLMEELVRLKPNVIVSGTMGGVIAAKRLTDTIPIISESLTDPVGFGFAASHNRPGGNVTGVLLTVEDLPAKQFALAVEMVPGASKIGLLINPSGPTQVLFRRSVEDAARALGVELVVSAVAVRDELHGAFQRLARENAKIVVLSRDTMYLSERKRIALLAMAERLPTMFGLRENVEDGGLMSYGINLRESYRRTAAFVVKVLKGAKPGDLPLEFPTKLELVINLAAAKALGLTVPPTLLATADEVIE